MLLSLQGWLIVRYIIFIFKTVLSMHLTGTHSLCFKSSPQNQVLSSLSSELKSGPGLVPVSPELHI